MHRMQLPVLPRGCEVRGLAAPLLRMAALLTPGLAALSCPLLSTSHLQVSDVGLEAALTTRAIETRGERIVKRLDCRELGGLVCGVAMRLQGWLHVSWLLQ